MVTALTAAQTRGGESADVVEFLLSNLSKRMSDALRGEIEEQPKIRTEDSEAAMSKLVNSIRMLEANGEITLLTKGD